VGRTPIQRPVLVSTHGRVGWDVHRYRGQFLFLHTVEWGGTYTDTEASLASVSAYVPPHSTVCRNKNWPLYRCMSHPILPCVETRLWYMISHEWVIVIFLPSDLWYPMSGGLLFFSLWYMISHEWVIVIFFPLIYDIPWVGDYYFFPYDLWYPMSGWLLFFFLWYMISHEWGIVIFFPLIYDIPWVGDYYFFPYDLWYPMSGWLLFFFLKKKNNNPPLMGYHISEEKK
jgi:hypothetical protein